jgi:hypothetical protein
MMPHLAEGTSWIEYFTQIQKVAQALDKAHPALPKNEKVIDIYLELCRDHLHRKGIAFIDRSTGKMSYRALPLNQILWLEGRSEYYTGRLRALHPQPYLDPLPGRSHGLLGVFEGIPKPTLISVGVILLLFLAVLGMVLYASSNVAHQSTSTLSEPSASRKSLSIASSQSAVPSPALLSSAQVLARSKDLLSASASKREILQTRDRLREIPASAPEYIEARRLLDLVDDRLNR